MQLVRDSLQPIMAIKQERFKGSADVYLLRDDLENVLCFSDKAAAFIVMQSVIDSPDYECFFFQHQTSLVDVVPDEHTCKGYNVQMITASWANTAGDVIPITLLPGD